MNRVYSNGIGHKPPLKLNCSADAQQLALISVCTVAV